MSRRFLASEGAPLLWPPARPPWLQKYKPLIERLPPRLRFVMHRAMEQWEYGAGKDYKL